MPLGPPLSRCKRGQCWASGLKTLRHKPAHQSPSLLHLVVPGRRRKLWLIRGTGARVAPLAPTLPIVAKADKTGYGSDACASLFQTLCWYGVEAAEAGSANQAITQGRKQLNFYRQHIYQNHSPPKPGTDAIVTAWLFENIPVRGSQLAKSRPCRAIDSDRDHIKTLCLIRQP